MLCYRVAQLLTRATPTSHLRLLTTNAAILLFAYSAAASTSARLRCRRPRFQGPLRRQGRARHPGRVRKSNRRSQSSRQCCLGNSSGDQNSSQRLRKEPFCFWQSHDSNPPARILLSSFWLRTGPRLRTSHLPRDDHLRTRAYDKLNRMAI